MSEERQVEVARALQIAIGALADIGTNFDLSRDQMQHKAMRVYKELTGHQRPEPDTKGEEGE